MVPAQSWASWKSAPDTSPRPMVARMNALTIKAWNVWRDGETIRTLSWKQGGTFRMPFPVPK
jgi:hypothetical protein